MAKKVLTPRLQKLPADIFRNSPLDVIETIRKNFDELIRYFDENGQLNGFKHLTFDVPLGSTELKLAHNLGFIPRDVIVTRLLAPTGTKLTILHSLFTNENIVVTMSGTDTSLVAKVRMLVGTVNTGEEGTDSFPSGLLSQEFKGQGL